MASEVLFDSSALIAIISGEDGAQDLLKRASTYTHKFVCAPTLLETAMVLVGRKNLQVHHMESFVERMKIQVEPFDSNHLAAALVAFAKYGKGRHPAGLNFGDCIAYSMAKLGGIPILFVGDDFSKTDLQPA